MGFGSLVTGEWWRKKASSIGKFISKNIVVLIIISALGASLIVYYKDNNPELAWRISITGIGAALFKAFQVSGIFNDVAKKAFEEVIKSENFKKHFDSILTESLKNETNTQLIQKSVIKGMLKNTLSKLSEEELYKYWDTASRLLYKKKFPAIHDRLHKIIVEKYLPINFRYYASSLDCEIHILKIENGYFHTEEIIKANYHSDSDTEFLIPNNVDYEIDDLSNDSGSLEVEVEIYRGTLNDHGSEPIHSYESSPEDIKLDPTRSMKIWSKDFKFSGSNDYYVYRKIKKIYPYKRNETKTYTFASITHKITAVLCMDASVQKQITGDYVRLGTIEKFTEDKLEAKKRQKGILCVRYDNLILPAQGFMFHFKDKK